MLALFASKADSPSGHR